DGHRYIPVVLKKGALAVFCEEAAPGEPRLVVKDVMQALHTLTSWNRQRLPIPYVAVTGSVGKTTAKEMIFAVLSARHLTFKTPGSLNGQLGIPVAFLSLSEEHEAAVVEMGISLPGEMERIARIVRPDMAVFMNITDAHLEALHSREGILREKESILSASPAYAPVVINGDDEMLCNHDFGRPTVRFGLGKNCDVRAEGIRANADCTEQYCTVVSGDRSFELTIPAYGNYMVYAALAAVAVGMALGLTDEEIAAGVAAYETVGHRSRVLKIKDFTLIDDCYNANPTANRAAVSSMLQLPGRHICVLGDMREMGENSHGFHVEVGHYLAENGVDMLFTQGQEAAHFHEGAPNIPGGHFESKRELAEALKAAIRPGDVVLVKASRGAAFEDVVAAIQSWA
ncbi:MAG: UDP-N-acetylmuramoyl-tripeptide--D-alanyl-D-alanine ligase, partial [Oscillospiraceae bacterium]|nr:UDP-N-acetylmuramoyl-tripeptide--D-alanyl-D-alanine ligase [Oscillospiraceae bacterium]